ncbi:Os04g0355300 [Oryza sativa Japonica Group]|uniref:Fatty acyl-CoA reductase n=1 Tax=Oryza sativa subsp. japonica TaxID=39947 RepID=C7J129_ORYSJ|nr:Os04g0355300 [Oryza sativa Japonica Group]|eukprot:NP_001173890.1 Os04g0355300 [Oryza sativa Japonica Group]
MEPGSIAERFRDRSILITGSTGFLAKMLVEKILRIQPDVRKLYLLVRAPDAAAAKERLLTEEKDYLMFCENNTVHLSTLSSRKKYALYLETSRIKTLGLETLRSYGYPRMSTSSLMVLQRPTLWRGT